MTNKRSVSRIARTLKTLGMGHVAACVVAKQLVRGLNVMAPSDAMTQVLNHHNATYGWEYLPAAYPGGQELLTGYVRLQDGTFICLASEPGVAVPRNFVEWR